MKLPLPIWGMIIEIAIAIAILVGIVISLGGILPSLAALAFVASFCGLWLLGRAVFRSLFGRNELKHWQWIFVVAALLWGVYVGFVVSGSEFSPYLYWKAGFFILYYVIPVGGGYVVVLLAINAVAGWSGKPIRNRFLFAAFFVLGAILYSYSLFNIF